MLGLLGTPVKTVYSSKDYMYLVSFDSPEQEAQEIRRCFKKIRRSKGLFERKLLSWKGYYCHDDGERYECFVVAAFVLTRRRIYISYMLDSEINLTVADITSATSYDFGKSEYDGMMSFTLLTPVMHSWYDSNESFTKKLKKKMHRIGVHSLRDVFEEIFNHEKRSA